jgi:hypothetical protein
MLLDPDDPLSQPIPLKDAAAQVSVSERTVRRWVKDGKLKLIDNMPGKWVTVRAVTECERDRYLAGHAGRPGARTPGLTV